MFRVVNKGRTCCDGADDEVVIVESTLQLLDQLLALLEGAAETFEVETESGLHRSGDVDRRACSQARELELQHLAHQPRRILAGHRAVQLSPSRVPLTQPGRVERAIFTVHSS